MAELDFWHPVATSEELRDRPLAVTVCGREIALFRTGRGARVGAVEDRCPHRRMRLSAGKVEGERIVCPYHGWSIDREGDARSPLDGGTSQRACITHYAAEERHGAIWVKDAASKAAFPEMHEPGSRCVFVMRHRMEAPLELVLDNFAELEHSVTTHTYFGYEKLDQATSETAVEGDTLSILHRGRQKRASLLFRLMFRVHDDDWLEVPTRFHFTPVFMVSAQRWRRDSEPGKVRETGNQLVIFFTPVTDRVTDVLTFDFASPALLRQLRLVPYLGVGLLRYFADLETRLDQKLLAQLADKNPGLSGMRLQRLDKPLGIIRSMVNRLYRGKVEGEHAEGAA